MDRLYAMLFDVVFAHLRKVQARRSDFVHGNAEAIDDALN